MRSRTDADWRSLGWRRGGGVLIGSFITRLQSADGVVVVRLRD